MKKRQISLRTGYLTIILVCWVLPILVILIQAGVMFGRNYRQSVQQDIDTSAANALKLMQMQLENAIDDSKAVSYDGVVRQAYQDFQRGGSAASLYGAVSNYLSQSFTRQENYQAVFIYFWEADANAYVLSDGTTSYGLLRRCQACTGQIMEEMADADTQIRFLVIDGQLYMARNLLDSTFRPYGGVVMMMQPENFFRSLSAVNRVENPRYSVDGWLFSFSEDGGELTGQTQEDWLGDVYYEMEADGHTIAFSGELEGSNFWGENPWTKWAALLVTVMVLPLLIVTIAMFHRHVTRPMETLAQANQQVRAGRRGYQIEEAAPNQEFARLYENFNAMSVELKQQFERSYLEQQATQQAQIKALQSQINPHFLNNTLEIINWEARIAGNDRVSAMIEALSTMLTAALDRDGRTKIALSEEIGYVDAYLYIIHERLGEGFRVHKQIQEDVLERMVPRMILQPLVENAVEHDITARRGGDLWVRVYVAEGRMNLEVEHDGTLTQQDKERIAKLLSDSGETQKGSRVGLRNVSRRLRLIYGEQGALTLAEVRPGSVLARVTFPV